MKFINFNFEMICFPQIQAFDFRQLKDIPQKREKLK